MDFRVALVPLSAAGLGMMVLAALALGRTGAQRSFVLQAPRAWGGLLAVACALVALRLGGEPSVGLPPVGLGRGVGFALLLAAAGLTLLGTRTWLHAELPRAESPRSIDEGVAALRAGHSPRWGIYRGRLSAHAQVTSPGGVVCAFYDAELRGLTSDGSKGPLLSRERAYPPVITVRGEHAEAAVGFAPSLLRAPVRPRRCQMTGSLAGPGLLAEGSLVEEVLSYERVGKFGEECLVLGKLRPGPSPGSYVIRGRQGGPAVVIVGSEATGMGDTLGRRAWWLLGTAGTLSVAAAWVLSRAL